MSKPLKMCQKVEQEPQIQSNNRATEERRMWRTMCSPILLGYSVRKKKWKKSVTYEVKYQVRVELGNSCL